MNYPLKCTKCNKKTVISTTVSMYTKGKPFKCKSCGGIMERYYPSDNPSSIKTTSSPSR